MHKLLVSAKHIQKNMNVYKRIYVLKISGALDLLLTNDIITKSKVVILLLTCKERVSTMPASQNGTKAKYARRRPASYLCKTRKEIGQRS